MGSPVQGLPTQRGVDLSFKLWSFYSRAFCGELMIDSIVVKLEVFLMTVVLRIRKLKPREMK